MTIQEFYTSVKGDYNTAKQRLLKDERIHKYLLKFLEDKSMQSLEITIAENNREASFIAAHTLKGVASNLSLTELEKCASALTEQLRSLEMDPDINLYQQLKEVYTNTIKQIQKLT